MLREAMGTIEKNRKRVSRSNRGRTFKAGAPFTFTTERYVGGGDGAWRRREASLVLPARGAAIVWQAAGILIAIGLAGAAAPLRK